MAIKISYKQIFVSEISDEICVFHLSESRFVGEELFIMGVAQFVEYAEYFKPKYVLIDKRNLEYEMPEILSEYIRKNGLDNLRKIGVKKVFQIVGEDFLIDKDNEVRFKEIPKFKDIESCLDFIKKEQHN